MWGTGLGLLRSPAGASSLATGGVFGFGFVEFFGEPRSRSQASLAPTGMWLKVCFREQACSHRGVAVGQPVWRWAVASFCFRASVRPAPGAWLKPGSVRKVMGWPWAL